MEMSYVFVIVASIMLFIVCLVILLHLSESRFTRLTLAKPNVSYPQPHNPYDSSLYPVEMFEETSPYKSAGPRLTLYDQVNRNSSDLKGNKVTYEESVKDIANFNALSLVVGPYTQAEIFSFPHFRRSSFKLKNDKDVDMVIQEFKGDFKALANGIRSVKLSIIAPYVIVFTEQNNGGISKIIRKNVPILEGKWNDSIESLLLSPYTRVKLFEHSNYRGGTKVYTNDTGVQQMIGFVGADFTDKTSSLQVESLMNVKNT